jgi:hypothetical protein
VDTTEERRRAQQIVDDYNRVTQLLRADKDLTDDGRNRQLIAAYDRARVQLNELRTQEQSRLASRGADLERRLFGLAGHANGADAISARDALDRASQLKSTKEAAALLQRADSTGDDVLARAIASTAAERSRTSPDPNVARAWDGVIRTYVDARPTMSSVVEELAQIERLSQPQVFSPFSVAKPRDVPTHVLNSTPAEPQEVS